MCKESEIVPGQNGVFARENLIKGECFEWGIAVIINNYDINATELLYIWDSNNKKTSATLSGCALFYNTLGDNSNVRCVPYHNENRYEMYALMDIPKGTELTIRYDSMNWRETFKELNNVIRNKDN
uniref:SET domain-containing protein n=1 Tax=viral metagenome TaxID=1070528 RepID=A0A6C0KJ29_9ZZZZ